jgi:hypothetical protein
MKWQPGEDKQGVVQQCADGLPAFYISHCRNYSVSRALTPRGPLYDAWKIQVSHRGGFELPLQLAGGVESAKAAIAACVEYANGIHP